MDTADRAAQRRTPYLFLAALLLACAAGSAASDAEPGTRSEYEVKAAFLYNFAKFVEWPAEAFEDKNAPIIICVLGGDPFGTDLDRTVQGKTANARGFVVKRSTSVEDVGRCHILFVSSSEQPRLREVLDKVKDSNVLTVGDTEGFAERGGIINLTKEENKIRFEVNVDAAKRAGLKISSKLLDLAKVIRNEPGQKER